MPVFRAETSKRNLLLLKAESIVTSEILLRETVEHREQPDEASDLLSNAIQSHRNRTGLEVV